MEPAEHIAHLATEGSLLATAAGRSDLDTPVPTCPEWTVRDLVRHTGGVHQWATAIVVTPHTEPWDVDLEDVVGEWPPDRELVDWYRAGHRRLVTALRDADPGLRCFTFLDAPAPLAMWARRQAHETAIHRVDAESAAAGELSRFDAAFAADGIDELLSCFITRGARRLRRDPPRTLRVHATDTGDVWDVHFHDGPVRTVRTHSGGHAEATSGGHAEATSGGHADAALGGAAAQLYLALWSRRHAGGLSVSGDPDTVAHLLDNVHIRWS